MDLTRIPAKLDGKDKPLYDIVQQPTYDHGKGAYMVLIRNRTDGKLSTVNADKLTVADKPGPNLG